MKVTREIEECFDGVLRVFQGSFKGVSRKCHGCFMKVSCMRKCHGCFLGVSWFLKVFPDCFKEV